MEDVDELKAYAEELGQCGVGLTLSGLISSHRTLRVYSKAYHTTLAQDRREASDKAYKDAREWADKNLYFSVERLREMTLMELTEYLEE